MPALAGPNPDMHHAQCQVEDGDTARVSVTSYFAGTFPHLVWLRFLPCEQAPGSALSVSQVRTPRQEGLSDLFGAR